MFTPEEMDELLHAPAMEKVRAGASAHWAKLMYLLAKHAKESNAAISCAKFGFVGDEEAVSAKYIPEISITIRRPSEE